MKKKLALILSSVAITSALLCGCNKAILDTTYHFDKAILSLPDGTVISGTVSSWTDYEDGDQIQVTIEGVVYLVHSSKIVLIHEK